MCGHKFESGELGPGTIVGSAAFNMFVIIGICVWTIPNGESRKIKHLRVFFITAFWSIFAYIWLYLILSVMTPGVVEVRRMLTANFKTRLLGITAPAGLVGALLTWAGVFQVWEALVTLLFFPVCVILAWIADRRLLFYKYMGKHYRADKRHGIVVETEGDLTPNKGGMEMIVDGKIPPIGGTVVTAENCGQDNAAGAAANNINMPNSNSATMVESSKELDESRREVRRPGDWTGQLIRSSS